MKQASILLLYAESKRSRQAAAKELVGQTSWSRKKHELIGEKKESSHIWSLLGPINHEIDLPWSIGQLAAGTAAESTPPPPEFIIMKNYYY